MQKKFTIKDIAKKAGVSHTVVSIILNKKENERVFVSEKKKEEILELIERYGYIPRKSARDLASQRTNTIGLIFQRLTPYFSSLVEELQKQAFKKGLEIMPYITEGYPEREEGYLNLMRDGRVDGVITTAFVEGSPARYLKFSSFPYNLKIVTIGPPVENIPSIYFDEEEAGRIAASHLTEIGCKRLCFFGGVRESGRAEGFVKFKEERLPSPLVFTGEKFVGYFHEGEKLAKEFFKLKELPDGVFASNDLLAVALLSEVLKRGLKIPENLAIMGCDNTEVCLHSYPGLTSIDVNISLTAQIALEKLIDFINGKEVKPLHTTIPIKLVERESTKKGG